MATTSTTPATTPALTTAIRRFSGRLLEHWHLLSLDAPTVAVVWAWAFARASGVPFPAIDALLLGTATWLLYVADRLLDGLQAAPALKERHRFHARHRRAFVLVALPVCAVLVWLVVARLDPAVRTNDLKLAAAAGLYLLCVHLRPSQASSLTRLFPKELAVAVIFATACVLPAWTGQLPKHPWLLAAGALFACLCWMNCLAIEAWEWNPRTALHAGTRTMLRYQRPACFGLAVAAALFAAFAGAEQQPGFAALAVSVAVSASLLLVLDRLQARLTPLHLRAAADAVLLTPLLMMPLCTLLTRSR